MDLLLFSVILFAGIVPPGVIALMGYFASKKLSSEVLEKANLILAEAYALSDGVKIQVADTEGRINQKIAGIEVRMEDKIDEVKEENGSQMRAISDSIRDAIKNRSKETETKIIKIIDDPERRKTLTDAMQKALKHQINGLIGADTKVLLAEMEQSEAGKDITAALSQLMPEQGANSGLSAGERIMNSAINRIMKELEGK